MKNIRIVISAMLTVSVLGLTPLALAHEGSHAETAAVPATPTKTLAERIAENKTKQATKLTALQEANLKTKCKLAQTKSTALAKKITDSDTARVKAYTNIAASLETLTAKLDAADYDTAALEVQHTKLDELVDAYKTDVANYKQALADVNELDCVTDPVGYKATLETARTARGLVSKDALAIRSYVTNEIKPALTTAQTALAKKTTTDGGTE